MLSSLGSTLVLADVAGWEHGVAGEVLPVPEAADEGRQSVRGGQLLQGQPEANTVDLGHIGRHPAHPCLGNQCK